MDAYLDFFFSYVLAPFSLKSWVRPCLLFIILDYLKFKYWIDDMTIDFFISENHIFVSIFLRDSHFDPYLLFSPLLVPKIKKSDLVFVLFVNVLTAKS